METIHILNPAAGQGDALKFSELDNVYITKSKGDACRFIKEKLKDNVPYNFAVYGGDGTVNEAVNGVISSKVADASVTVVPTGTGNDLIRTVEETCTEAVMADVLTIGDGYAVNAVNTGFDLDVVLKAAEWKKRPFISGSLAYILGIFSALFGKYGKHLDIEYTDQDGNKGEFHGECLLCVAANGRYYGGGFCCSPTSEITDGLIDLMIVKKVSRLRFMLLVAKYQKGLHIDKQLNAPAKGFENILTYRKCTKVVIDGLDKICCDGEVAKETHAEIGVLPKALKIVRRK